MINENENKGENEKLIRQRYDIKDPGHGMDTNAPNINCASV